MSDDAFQVLCEGLGGPAIDRSDEHDRWAIYSEAMTRHDLHGALLNAVRQEEDVALATSVVVHMLETVRVGELAAWVEAIAPDDRAFVLQRKQERLLLETILDDGYSDAECGEVDDWSDWVQRRAAARASGHDLLAVLAQSGRTRRVRATAAERLRRR